MNASSCRLHFVSFYWKWFVGVFSCALVSSPAFAILDQDVDGMSDVWEVRYGFSVIKDDQPAQLPTADPDGDGISNLNESLAGTDPLSGKSPQGVYSIRVAKNVSDSSRLDLSWPQSSGKEYQVESSLTLAAASWTAVGVPWISGATPLTFTTPAPVAGEQTRFFRIRVKDADSDGDDLSNAEENALGTNSGLADTDGDGISDKVEFLQGSSPILASESAAPAIVKPSAIINAPVTNGGFSVPLAVCDDVSSEWITKNCTLTNQTTVGAVTQTSPDEIGVLKATPTATNSTLVPRITEMVASAGHSFDTAVYKKLRIRMLAPSNAVNGFALEWKTQLRGNSAASSIVRTGSIVVPHVKGVWTEHTLDFTSVPEWKGDLMQLSLRVLSGPAGQGTPAVDLNKMVKIDYVELVAGDSGDTLFSNLPVLMNVMKRLPVSGGFKTYWDDLDVYGRQSNGDPKISDPKDGSVRVFYFAKDAGTGRKAIYRYFRSTTNSYLDLDSETAPEGYVQDVLLGYVWDSRHPGMSPVQRCLNPVTGKYALVPEGESLPGFIPDRLMGYAYSRNEVPSQEFENESDAKDDIYQFVSGDLTFGLNLDHGASGWSWTHKLPGQPRREMINVNDFGRQMQLSYYFNHVDFGVLNPSEVGFSRGQVGCPVAHVHRVGNTIVTRTVPLDYNPDNVLRNESSVSRPYLHPGMMLGKEVTFGILGHPHLAKWTAYVHTPTAIWIGNSSVTQPFAGSQFEILSNHPTADFSYRANVEFDDAGNLIEDETESSLDGNIDGTLGIPRTGLGGNILARSNDPEALAFGMMIGTYVSDPAVNLSAWNYSFAGETRTGSARHTGYGANGALGAAFSSPFSGSTMVQRAVMRTPTVSGVNRYTTYIMSGTLAEVKGYMKELYDARNHLEW